jgi:hypothetical protein
MQALVWQSITVARYTQPCQVGIGDVADELGAGHVGGEVAVEQVRDGAGVAG